MLLLFVEEMELINMANSKEIATKWRIRQVLQNMHEEFH